MNHNKVLDAALLLIAIFMQSSSSLSAQVPIEIEGTVANENIQNNSAWFRIPAASGYSYFVTLDDQRVPTDLRIDVTDVDYHELQVYRTNLTTLAVTNFPSPIRFIVRNNSDRGTTEDGLITWTPYPVVNAASAELAGARLDIMAPDVYPAGMEIPIVAWIRNSQDQAVRANGLMTAEGHPSIQLRRGVGSGFLGTTNPPGIMTYSPQLPGLLGNKIINIEADTSWTSFQGALSQNTVWDDDARIAVTADLTIAAGVTLTIADGAIVRLSPGVNITVNGLIRILGTTSRPVVFTPLTRNQPWGGFFMQNTTSRMEANAAIFIAAGAAQSGYPGHRNEQPLFYLDHQAQAALTNCAAIYLAGQFFHSNDRGTDYGSFIMSRSLIQRCTTGGEFWSVRMKFLESAFIEVPIESGEYGAEIDSDHDGFYLDIGEYEFRDSLFGWMKDDCMDSGSGGVPVTINVSNCWIEAAYHEGCAWSNSGRSITNQHLVVMNSGQGIECGWSGGDSPLVYAEDCLSLGNGIGVRHGDNYDWDYNGFLYLTNSIVINNHRDVWGWDWDKNYNGHWNYRTDKMDIQGNLIGQPNSYHPNNTTWDPAADAHRLTEWLTTPADATVGVAFVTWGDQFELSELANGAPVGLSSFTTNTVTVDYEFRSADAPIGNGTLTFLPGETVKRAYPSGFNVSDYAAIEVVLGNSTNGELTGKASILYAGSVSPVEVAHWVAAPLIDVGRIGEGVPIRLSLAQSAAVDYRYETSSSVLASGTVVFDAGQAVQWIPSPGINPAQHDVIRLTLSHPINAGLGNLSQVYFMNVGTTEVPPNVTLIPRGANWKYHNLNQDLGAAWRALGYNDSTWPSGPAELGNGDGNEATQINIGPSGSRYPTVYFRHHFQVTNPASFESLQIGFRRDDGGVVYLNGQPAAISPNMPSSYNHFSYTDGDTTSETTYFADTASASLLVEGDNVCAVEVHQGDNNSSDISFDLDLVAAARVDQRVYLARFGEELVVLWANPGYVLDEADDITGDWREAAASSPMSVVPSPGQKFYRLRK